MQLRALELLWRAATEVQVGTDPRWAVALTDLSPSAASTLAGLAAGSTVRAMTAALRAEAVPDAEIAAVLDHLRAAHLVVAPSTDDPAAPTRADARTHALLALDGDAAPLLARRARAVVRIVGIGRTGAVLAAALAAAGIGTLHLDDERPTRPEEVGFGGLRTGDTGRPHGTVLAATLLEARPGLRTLVPAGRSADLVVLLECGVADPVAHAPLLDAGIAHLSVVIGEASVRVGPLVVPGRTACLRCLDLHRTDADPCWPAVAAQLAAAPARAARTEETTLALMAAACAATQVLAHVDGRPATTHGGALEIALPLGLPVAQQWAPHPRCGCGARLAEEVSDDRTSEVRSPSGVPGGGVSATGA